MLKMNVAAFLQRRGIENPVKYLRERNMPYQVINKVLMNKTDGIKYKVLEKLCIECGCTPDELMTWIPDEGSPVGKDHPLQKLKPKQAEPSPVERIKKLPLHKMEKLKELLDGLEKE